MRYLTAAVVDTLVAERKMAFVAGPRQVGKTTLARALLPERTPGYYNWDVETHRRAVLRDPVDFWRDAAHAGTDRCRIVLDEIHKYPRWKRLLKGLFDAHRDALEVVVTGSGRLDTYQRGGDSLLGRYNLHRLHPFTVGELLAGGEQSILAPDAFADRLQAADARAGAPDALDLIERYTGFPEPLFAATRARLTRWRRTRRQLVLREDLRDLSRVRELGLIDQLVSLLPERVGSPLSVNALREDLQVAFTTVQNWLAILERLYFLFEIRPYAGRLARTLRREGKVYLFDQTEIEAPGARFENVVALHLLKLVDAWNDLGHGDYALHYVRDKEKREVDFLVTERRRLFLLVEAKLHEEEPSPALRYFTDRLLPRHSVQVVRYGRPRASGVIQVIPADRFLALV